MAKPVKLAPREIKPSDLLRLYHQGVRPAHPVAVDTETSGLFVDDGARCSTVSVAFVDTEVGWGFVDSVEWGGGIHARTIEAVDAELSVPVVSFAWPYDQGVSGTGKKEDDGYITMWPDADNLSEAEWEALLEWLRLVGIDVGLTMHHAKFDLHILREGVRRWPGIGKDYQSLVTWDTQNGNALLLPTQVRVWSPKLHREVPTTSLKPTMEHLWGASESDEQKVIQAYLRKHKLPAGRWDLMPWDIIAKYAMHDANGTARLRLWQERRIAEGNLPWLGGAKTRGLLDRRLATSKMLYRMEKRGLPWSTDKAWEISALLQERQQELIAALPFSPPTLNAAKDFWFTDKGLNLTPYARTDGGAPSVTEAVIDKMVERGVIGAEAWRNLQKAVTADSRWYQGWSLMCGSDGRLRCSIRQNGTVSSRFSVERIQLHAIPHDYRLSGFSVLEGIPTPRSVIAAGVPKGWKMWELDLAQAELRVAAQFAGCQTMLDIIESGGDPHGLTAEYLFQVNKDHPEWGFYRNIAKRGNFSLIFGVGWETFHAAVEKETGIVLGEAEARRIVSEWNKLYPEFKRAIYKHQSVVEKRMRQNQGVGWIDLLNGERRWFTPGEETHKAFNQRVQPNLAQFGNEWWLWTEAYLMGIYTDDIITSDDGEYVGRVGMLLTIHDSCVLLLPDNDESVRQVETIQQYGRDLWSEWFPGVSGDIDAKEWGK